MPKKLDPYGVVHGRFQPLHIGHLHYILKGLKNCEKLIIGITNSDPTQIQFEESEPNRNLESYNPFTFFERLTMVTSALVNDEGVQSSRFFVVPFPIHNANRWKYYLPDNAVHYISLTTEWDRTKLFRMREIGFKAIEIGRERYKGISGTEIRQLMIEGKDWKSLVPKSVAEIIDNFNGEKRVQELAQKESRKN
jgi:nicotinamide-nucleotide adenylyltransferase